MSLKCQTIKETTTERKKLKSKKKNACNFMIFLEHKWWYLDTGNDQLSSNSLYTIILYHTYFCLWSFEEYHTDINGQFFNVLKYAFT